MRYKLIDHTADFGIHVFGTDPKDLFANAAYALFDLITDIDTLSDLDESNIRVFGEDWPDMMVNWLRELLYLWSGKELLVKKVHIQFLTENELSANVMTDPYDPDRHAVKIEIKAVTYHQIQVFDSGNGWQAQIIFDA